MYGKDHDQVTRRPIEPPSIPAYGTFSKKTKDQIFDIDFMRYRDLPQYKRLPSNSGLGLGIRNTLNAVEG